MSLKRDRRPVDGGRLLGPQRLAGGERVGEQLAPRAQSNPQASYSSRCQPMPTPSSRRPPDRQSSVAAVFASSAGRRSEAIRIPVASRTRSVAAAMPASSVSGSGQSSSGVVGEPTPPVAVGAAPPSRRGRRRPGGPRPASSAARARSTSRRQPPRSSSQPPKLDSPIDSCTAVPTSSPRILVTGDSPGVRGLIVRSRSDAPSGDGRRPRSGETQRDARCSARAGRQATVDRGGRHRGTAHRRGLRRGARVRDLPLRSQRRRRRVPGPHARRARPRGRRRRDGDRRGRDDPGRRRPRRAHPVCAVRSLLLVRPGRVEHLHQQRCPDDQRRTPTAAPGCPATARSSGGAWPSPRSPSRWSSRRPAR